MTQQGIASGTASDLERRKFLKVSASTTAAAALGGLSSGFAANGAESQAQSKFRTPLCDLLKIDYPVIQAGMSGVAGPELVAAVSNAGGLGILTAALLPPDELRNRIRKVRELTDRPFGVNFLLHTDLRPPKDPAGIADTTLQSVHGVLNRFRRRLGLAESFARPPAAPDFLNAAFAVMLEERVAVWSIGLGTPPPEMVQRCHGRGIKVIAMVATVEDAVEVAATGVDAIVAQGSEAGGHRSTWVKKASRERASIGAMALVPQVVAKVKVPVIAAGGITNGKGLVAAIALGAQGVMIGTRFIATSESIAPDFHKRALIDSSSDATTVTDVFTGMYARVLRNTFTEEYAASGAPVLPPFAQFLAARDVVDAAVAKNDKEYFTLYCGQGIGTFSDMPSAGAVVQQIIREARAELAQLPMRVQQV